MLSTTIPFCGNTSPERSGVSYSCAYKNKKKEKGEGGEARWESRSSGRAFFSYCEKKKKKPCPGDENRGDLKTKTQTASTLLSGSSLGWTGDESLEKDPSISRKRKRMPSSLSGEPYFGETQNGETSLSTARFLWGSGDLGDLGEFPPNPPNPPLPPNSFPHKTDCVSERGEASDEEDIDFRKIPAPYLTTRPLSSSNLEDIRFPSDTKPVVSQSLRAAISAEIASTDIERNNPNNNKKQTKENPQDIHDRALSHIPSYDDPYYLYLMVVGGLSENSRSPQTSGKNSHTAQKTLTHVGKSRQPIRCVDLHNKRLLPSKLTQSAAGQWELELVVGPVGDRRQAASLKQLWCQSTRGPITRRQFGKFLANELGVPCYDRSLGQEKSYTNAWSESRIKRRRARRASKAASQTTMRRHKAAPIFLS